VRYYGQWMRDEAEKRIGHLYPKVTAWLDPRSGRYFGESDVGERRRSEERGVRSESGEKTTRECGHPSLSSLLSTLSSHQLTVIAWLWARTVKSPNPAFAHVDVPLASTFMLSTKAGKEAYVEVVREEERGVREEERGEREPHPADPLAPHSSPLTSHSGYRFTVKTGKPKDAEGAKNGTKLARGANFKCVMSGAPISGDHIKAEGKAGRMGARLMAIVAEGTRGRVYLAPTPEHEAAALKAQPDWKPESSLPDDPRNFWTVQYGLTTYGDLFTPRQLVALTTFSDLVGEAIEKIKRDAIAAGLPDDGLPLAKLGAGGTAYAEAVGVYLGLAVGRSANYWSSLTPWGGDFIVQTFGRQALPMVWDYAEGNPLSDSTGNWTGALSWIQNVMERALPAISKGQVTQADAQTQSVSLGKVISTDPPYYDNIGYADLSDYFYVWHRRAMRSIFPELFATMAVPKAEELVATPYRHGSKEKAETFFLDGMTQAMHRLAEQAHPAYPVTIYYAFKQSESDGGEGTTNTGWDTFLAAVIEAGFAISGTWPMRTERDQGLKTGSNSLASSIVLVCRPRLADAPTATRREFHNLLKTELPAALAYLQAGNIAPVDLAQAAIGPGMAVYTRFAKVLDADGKPLPVRAALALINQVLDEALAEQEGDFDADTRWALAWFEQIGFEEGEFGVAEQLSKAKNTAVSGLVEAGLIASGKGKVRLLQPAELPADWDPGTDTRLTVWESVHHLIRVLEAGGEAAAATLVAKLGSQAEIARELCYRLYTVCERKKRAVEAMAYNALVQSWPEIARLARETAKSTSEPVQAGLL
jgi:putative DNA methylase